MLPPPRILIADDDDAFRRPLAELLRRQGCECVGVPNAAEAIAQLEAQEFDLLISDIRMPGNTQLELIRRAPQIADGLPIILLTGYPTVETASAAVGLPVAAYVTKPPIFDQLWKQAQIAIQRRRDYQAVLAQRQRLVQWSSDLDDIAARMKHSPGKPEDAVDEAYAALSIRNALESLIDLKRFTEKRPTEAKTQQTPPPELAQALEMTIVVLEQTKQNFKSKRLGDLRQHLESVLQKSVG